MTEFCNQSTPCWQHYGSHYNTQPSVKWGTDLAESLLRFRMRSLPVLPEVEDLQKVKDAAQLLINLQNARWRDCVREPFTFKPYAGVDMDEASYAEEGEGRIVNIAELLGLVQKPTVIHRR